LQSDLTPGITHRPERLEVDEILRVGGRVHAVVMRRGLAIPLFLAIPTNVWVPFGQRMDKLIQA
jgi:hypothetical protein